MAVFRLREGTVAQFAKFLAVGMLNTAFGYGVFALLTVADVPPLPALALTYVVGVTFNFVTTGRLVFDHVHRSAIFRFILVYIIVFLVNAALYELLAMSGIKTLVAQALCVPIMAVLSFVLFKFHVFGPGVPSNESNRAP